MRPLDLLLLILSSTAYALEERKLTASNDAQFSSAASQLISLYIPPSVASAIYSAATDASVSGSAGAVIESALTATVTPSFLTAVPSQYQPNIKSLDSAISALRVAASVGSISGAPRVVTSTNTSGSAVVTTIPGASKSSSSGSLSGSTTSSSKAGSSSSSLTSITRTSSQTSATLVASSTSSSSSSSSGLACATQVPGYAIGMIGLLGAFAAL